MHPVSPIRKIFQGVPDRRQMFRMFDRHVAATCAYERLALAHEDWNEELRAFRRREEDG